MKTLTALLSVRQAAEHIGVSKRTIYRWLNDRNDPMPRSTIRGTTRISRVSLDAWLLARDYTPS